MKKQAHAELRINRIKQKYRDDTKNIALPFSEAHAKPPLSYEFSANLADFLTDHQTAIAVTLEYDHQLVLISARQSQIEIQYLEIPHPSGIFYDGKNLAVSSTRAPNQIIDFRILNEKQCLSELPRQLPNLKRKGNYLRASDIRFPVLIPVRSYYLPGNFSVHDITKINQDLYVTATGLNFVAKALPDGGYERVWHPKCLDRLGQKAFVRNYLQLNSMTRGGSIKNCFFTAFSDKPTREKPWKAGYGPKQKGVVFEGSTRETVYRGFTCPHSVRQGNGQLWLCDSGMGELGTLDPKRGKYTMVAQMPGFTRGLAFLGEYAVVGLSKVIPSYEPYAPALDAKKSQCGLMFVNTKTGQTAAWLKWPRGFQIYDVQTLEGLNHAVLPVNMGNQSMNYYLTYFGWKRE